ncbi:MAG: hypothetical protein MUE79_06325, partial [Nitratireductor sp.]|nr:hypothetical protein [Nitratireductor sp.]
MMGTTPRRTAPPPRAPDAPVREGGLPSVLSETLAAERGAAVARLSARAAGAASRTTDVAASLL